MSDFLSRMYCERIHFVYRAFDEYGHLLYIGCTMNPQQRWKAHQGQSAWAKYATRFTMQGPFYRSDAMALENLAINSEPCFFNATRAEIEQVMANWREARRRLSEIGIPSLAYFDDDGPEDAQNAAANEYVAAKFHMQQEIRDEFPFRTNEDRLADYLVSREAAEQVAS